MPDSAAGAGSGTLVMGEADRSAVAALVPVVVVAVVDVVVAATAMPIALACRD